MPRAVVCQRIGPWREVLSLTDMSSACFQPLPPGTIHIRVTCCGMGFPDLLQVEGKYQVKAQPPFVPVIYVAGVVIDPGESGFTVGDRVVGNAGIAEGHMFGGLAEEALLKTETALRIPDSMSDEVVLVMHENYWDVHHAISTCGKVSKDDTVLILGASGACGLAAIDLAKAFGARVVACASSDEKLAACARAGADIIINYEASSDGFLSALRQAGLYGNVSVVFDPVGGRYGEAAFRSLGEKGRYVVFGFAAGGTDPKSAFPQFPINRLLMKGQQIVGSMGTSRGESITRMFEMVKKGQLKPNVNRMKTYELANFSQAFDDLANRKAIGKVIVNVCNIDIANSRL